MQSIYFLLKTKRANEAERGRAAFIRRRVAGRLRCVARHHVEVFEVNNLWLRARRTAAFAQHLPSSFRPPPSPLTPNQDRSQEAGPSHSAGKISNVVRPPPPAVASYHVVLKNSQNRLRKEWLSGRKQDPHVKVLFRKKKIIRSYSVKRQDFHSKPFSPRATKRRLEDSAALKSPPAPATGPEKP